MAPQFCLPIIQSVWLILGRMVYNHGHVSTACLPGCKMNLLVFCVTMQDSVLMDETFWKPLDSDVGKENRNL